MASPERPFTPRELVALDRLLYGVIKASDFTSDDPEIQQRVELARGIRRKLRTMLPQVCRHCATRPRRGNLAHCKRCDDYKRKYGHLPTEQTLLKSARRVKRS